MRDKDTFETFKQIDGFAKTNVIQKEPSCFNGFVRVRKYKVTVELIDEPLDVIHARIQKLWDEGKGNHHHWEPLLAAARKHGLELKP